MPRVVAIPYNLSGQTMPAIAGAAFGDGRPSDNIVHFDFLFLTFTEPCGITLLANLVEWLLINGTTVHFVNVNTSRSPVKYLDDALFFEKYTGRKIDSVSSLRSTTLALQKITREESHAWIRTHLTPWLSGHMSINEASLYTLQASLSEIFNNIKDHTIYDIGNIFAQFFPKKKEIRISIADFGAGIPETVRRVKKDASDVEAIIAAVEYGFTSRSLPTNQGIGLHYLLNTTVLQNDGVVTIFSRSASVRFDRNSDGTLQSNPVMLHMGFYPGTTIEILLRTDRMIRLPDDEEDLTW